MKKSFVSTVALLMAIACLHAPTQSVAQSATPAAPADTLLTANTPPRYPLARTTFAEAIAKYSIGSGHRAMYANITGDRVWSIAQSKFGQPNAQSAIYEARRLCEEEAVTTKLDPGKCVPVAVDDRQFYDPGPLFSIAETFQGLQRPVKVVEHPRQE
jgi:hypothetical protein